MTPRVSIHAGAGEGWFGLSWSQGQNTVMEVVSQCVCPLSASLWGWRRFLGRQHGMKDWKEAPAVRSMFSCVFEASQPLMDLLMGSLVSETCRCGGRHGRWALWL